MTPNHQVDYDNESIKSFLQQLNHVLNNARAGVDSTLYDHFWRMMGNRDLATVYLSVLMGKLLQMENSCMQLIVSSKDRQDGGRPSIGSLEEDKAQQQAGAQSDSSNSSGSSGGAASGGTAPLSGSSAHLQPGGQRNSNADDQGGDASDAAAHGSAEDLQFDVNEIVNELQLGKHAYNANHPLLLKRKENIINRNFDLIIDQDEDYIGEQAGSSTAPKKAGSGSNSGQQLQQLSSQTKLSSLAHDKAWFTPEQLYIRCVMINSMIYLSLFYKFDFNNASLLHLIHTWTKLRQQIFQQKENHDKVDVLADEIREELIRLPSASALYKYVQLCIDYDVMEDGDASMPPPLNRYDPLTMVSSYAYSNLQAVSRVPEPYTEMILDDIILLLSRSITDNNAARFKNALRFIQLILPQLFVPSSTQQADNPTVQKLEVLLKLLKPHLIRPLPVGGMVRDTMQFISREMRCPGASMRERFERCVRRVKRADGTVGDERRTVYLLFNGHAQNAQNFADRVSVQNDMDKNDVDVVKANLVLNMFDNAFGEEESKALLALPFDTLARYYQQTKDVVDEAYEKNWDATQLQKALSSVRTQILTDRTPAKGEPLNTRRKSPQMPEPEFRTVELETEEDLLQCPIELKIYPRSICVDVLDRIVKEQLALKPDDQETVVLDLAIAGGSGTLMHLVHSHFVAQKLKLMKSVDIRLYLIPLGENNFMGSWLEKFDGWYSRHVYYPMLSALPLLPALKTGNDFNKQPSDLLNLRRPGVRGGSVLSMKAQLPISAPKTYVKKNPAKVPAYKSPTNFLTPHKFMRTLLNDYIVDANKSVPMYVYNAQCLCNELEVAQEAAAQGAGSDKKNPAPQQQVLKKGRKVKKFVSLCFAQRLEIGYVAEALQLQKNEKLDGLTLEELGQHKNFKYGGLNLVISYVPMDPTGGLVRTSDIMEPAKNFFNITIQAASQCGDKGALVAPQQPWLEVLAEEYSATKKKKPSKKDASSDSGMTTNYHVGSISVESTTAQQFSVVLDGEVFGTFHKILINPSNNTLNLQTFNNIDLY